MLSPMSQPCDLIKETTLARNQQQQLAATNCSNNSTAVSSIDGSAQGYLAAEKPPFRFHHNQSISQSVTPQFNLRANLRLDSEVTNSPVSFKTDTDLLNQFSTDDLVYRIKSLETKNRKLLFENGCLVRDLNSNLANVQYCKQEMSQLRDLCCYLDDERTKARLTATEWAFKLKKEINSYSRKLGELESKQFELVRENYELKQLCLLLDRVGENANDKDEDTPKEKSANDQPQDCKANSRHKETRSDHTAGHQDATSEPVKQRSLLNNKVMNYIVMLETKLEQCEEQRRSALSLLTDREMPLEEPIRELEKFRLDLDELKGSRPEVIERALQVFLVGQSLEQNLNTVDGARCADESDRRTDQAEDSQPNVSTNENAKISDESPLNDSPMGEDRKSVV